MVRVETTIITCFQFILDGFAVSLVLSVQFEEISERTSPNLNIFYKCSGFSVIVCTKEVK